MGKFRDEAQRRIDRDLADNVTPAKAFFSRRKFMVAAAGVGLAGSGLGLALAPEGSLAGGGANPVKDASLKPNSFADITQYNNFYEFGLGKDDPAKTAHALTTSPWSIEIAGLVDRPGSYSLQEIVSQMIIEERIYRFRCVEAWSMVVPWSGFELRQLLEMVGVKQGATHVSFETLVRPSEMWGQSGHSLEWPYREGLRLDEAMHPLTLMATGIYGKPIPNQNGAPVRLVVPWKYGFKSIKSIVRIEVTDAQPQSTWNMQNPTEYGFYSNVNPSVDHKRWSQATERKVGGGLLSKRQPTLMFNGYEDEVAHLYDGMDLRKNF